MLCPRSIWTFWLLAYAGFLEWFLEGLYPRGWGVSMFLVTVSWRTCDRRVPVGRRQTESDDTHDIDADADSVCTSIYDEDMDVA